MRPARQTVRRAAVVRVTAPRYPRSPGALAIRDEAQHAARSQRAPRLLAAAAPGGLAVPARAAVERAAAAPRAPRRASPPPRPRRPHGQGAHHQHPAGGGGVISRRKHANVQTVSSVREAPGGRRLTAVPRPAAAPRTAAGPPARPGSPLGCARPAPRAPFPRTAASRGPARL